MSEDLNVKILELLHKINPSPKKRRKTFEDIDWDQRRERKYLTKKNSQKRKMQSRWLKVELTEQEKADKLKKDIQSAIHLFKAWVEGPNSPFINDGYTSEIQSIITFLKNPDLYDLWVERKENYYDILNKREYL